MQFIKKHYEKIILGCVLLVLGAAAAYLPFALGKEKTDLTDLTNTQPPPKKYTPVNLTTNLLTLAEMKTNRPVALDTSHNVFNPVEWKSTTNNFFFKFPPDEKVLKVTAIRPLMLRITFDRVAGPGLYLSFLKESVSKRPVQKYATPGQKVDLGKSVDPIKSDFLLVREVVGPADDPTELLMDLDIYGKKESISLTKQKPFERIETYSADLRYEPESKNFPDSRLGHVLAYGGESYLIIEINKTEVKIKAQNTKVTTIRLPGGTLK